MCFSTKASFGAAIVLTGIGVIALNYSKTKTQRAVAIMPLIFAAQQLSEGVLWISLLHPEYQYLKRWAMYSFLTFAEMIWPVYIPFITLIAEQQKERIKWIKPLLVFGVCIVVMLTYGLIAFPTNAELINGHIKYSLKYPIVNTWYYGLIYFMPTIVAPMLSSNRMFRLLGVALFIAYVVSRIFYNHFVISIWCYFGAMISVMAIAMIRELAMENTPNMETRKARINR